jgi:hypothetical protein
LLTDFQPLRAWYTLAVAVPKPRSPVLGFNHNVRHLGWVFHVQTEDSGISNPHIFTHLFREGVIIATKKMVYDAEADVDVVKGLMQAQHKSVLKELKSGHYDQKIRQYLGAPPGETDYDDIALDEKDAPAAPPVAPPAAGAQTSVGAVADLADMPPGPSGSRDSVSAAFRAISHASAQQPAARTPTGNTAPPPPAPPVPPPPGSGVFVSKPQRQTERPFDRTGSHAAVPDPSAAPAGKRPSQPPAGTPPPSGKRGAGERDKPLTIPPHSIVEKGPVHASDHDPSARPGATPATGRPVTASPAAARPPAGAVARPAGSTGSPPSGRPSAVTPVAGKPAQPAAPARPTVPPQLPPDARLATGRPPMPAPSQPASPAAKVPQGPTPGTRPPVGTPVQPPRGAAPGSNVIVARPAVIVGAPPQVVGQRKGRETPPAPTDSIFGKDLISEKSLDEVIMAYLSEDANEE